MMTERESEMQGYPRIESVHFVEDHPIFRAITGNDLRTLIYHVEERNANVNQLCDVYHLTPLAVALILFCDQSIDDDIIYYLYLQGAVVGNAYFTTFHLCSKIRGFSYLLKHAIKCGENVNSYDHMGNTALNYAIWGNNVDRVIELITEYGADLNKPDARGITPMMYAAKLGSFEIFNHIYRFKTAMRSLGALTEDGSDLMRYIVEGGNIELFEFFVGLGVSYKHADRNGNTLLMHALTGKSRTIIHIVATMFPDMIHKPNLGGIYPIEMALKTNRSDIAAYFIETTTEWKDYASAVFKCACAKNYSEIVNLILTKGFVPGLDDFHVMLETRAASICNLVMQKAERPVALAQEEIDEIMLQAAKRSSTDFMQVFMAHFPTANVNCRDPDTQVTPLMLAAENGNVRMMRTLIEKGAEIDARDLEGETALFFASTPDAVDFLVNVCGMDINQCNTRDESVLYSFFKDYVHYSSENYSLLMSILQHKPAPLCGVQEAIISKANTAIRRPYDRYHERFVHAVVVIQKYIRGVRVLRETKRFKLALDKVRKVFYYPGRLSTKLLKRRYARM